MESLVERGRVLVAEDQVMVAELLQFQLEELGYRVVGRANNGAKAVEMAQALHPDVILMDLDMPEMDGIEAAHTIQTLCPMPVVVMTAFSELEKVKAASLAGVGAYLLKPPEPGNLERAITIARARFADLMELRGMAADLSAYDYSVSHDLKGPLNLILPYAELLNQECSTLSPQEMQTYTAIIMSQTRRARDIIESLLLIASPEAIHVELLDMAVLVKTACTNLATLIEQHHAEVAIPSTFPPVLGHPVLVERVWDNYLSNALKYGGRPPVLEIGSTQQVDGMVRFWVRDNGPGLSEEAQKQLFTPFTRISSLGSQPPAQGHGVGLSIVRRIVERLGGKVNVESAPGCGSTFSFTLPGA